MRVVFGRGGRPNGMVHFAVRKCLRWRVALLSLIPALACNQCTIPFCRKRVALYRKGGRHRQGRHWLVRTGLQNGIPDPPGLALAGEGLFRCFLPLRVALVPFVPALASSRFRLAGQSLAFSLRRWVSVMRVVFGRGGRPNGMVHLQVVIV